jgi:hypothetical protein
MPFPSASMTIEEEQQQLYTAVGRAIVEWQYVEAAVEFIFSNAIGTTEQAATIRRSTP